MLAGLPNAALDRDTATDGPYVALINTDIYIYSERHEVYDDINGIIGTDQRIASPTITNGLFDGDDVVFTKVNGSSVHAIIIYRKNAGPKTTWNLVAYFDTVMGLPVVPNGSDISITWSEYGIIQF